MGHGCIVISIFLCILFAPCYITSIESIDADGNLQMNEKNITSSRSVPFQFAKFQDKGSNTITHYAMWHTKPGQAFGLRAEISLWDTPEQENSQESGAAIQIYCKDGRQWNLIEIGFHVSPSLYQKGDIRFFTYWTAILVSGILYPPRYMFPSIIVQKDSKSKGCYNLQCKGFVPAIGGYLVPGQAIGPPSSYGTDAHYVTISLNKDPKFGDWVAYRHDTGTPSFLGYFPAGLCRRGTPRIQALAGFVKYPNNTHGPPMGSGHYPDEDDDDMRTAFFRQVKKYNSIGHASEPHNMKMVPLVDRPDCYTATNYFHDANRGYMFHYGGPSGCIG